MRKNKGERIVQKIQEHVSELKDMYFQNNRAHQVPSVMAKIRPMPRLIFMKFQNVEDKEKILKASRGKEPVAYKGLRIRMTSNIQL